MKKILSWIERFPAFVRGLFPTPLPTGKTEFEVFCQRVFWVYDLPDMRSYRQAIASMIMHLGPQTYRAPLFYFGKSIKKAQANQTAYSAIQELKKQEKEEDTKDSLDESLAASEVVTA